MTTSGGVIDLLQQRLAELHNERKLIDREIEMTRRLVSEAQRMSDELPTDAGVDAVKAEDGLWRQSRPNRDGKVLRTNTVTGERVVVRKDGTSRTAEPRYGRSVRTIVLEVMGEEPDRPWTSAQVSKRVHDKLGSRADGKLASNVRASLYAAKNAGEVERNEEDGTYRLLALPAPDTDPAPVGGQETGSGTEFLQLTRGGDSDR